LCFAQMVNPGPACQILFTALAKRVHLLRSRDRPSDIPDTNGQLLQGERFDSADREPFLDWLCHQLIEDGAGDAFVQMLVTDPHRVVRPSLCYFSRHLTLMENDWNNTRLGMSLLSHTGMAGQFYSVQQTGLVQHANPLCCRASAIMGTEGRIECFSIIGFWLHCANPTLGLSRLVYTFRAESWTSDFAPTNRTDARN
jgi:hypothetical protein